MRAPAVASAIVLVAALAGLVMGDRPRPAAGPSATTPEAHAAAATGPRLGYGRPATSAEIAAWDIDVSPDGTGLPPGKGTVAEGEAIYKAQCLACHGPDGQGGQYDRLAGREPGDAFPFGRDQKLLATRTIGNYWPYATTLYDYVHRAMPQAVPGSLQTSEVYAVVAYLLFLNGIVPRDTTLDAQTLPRVRMPARDRFVPDDRRGGPEVR